MTKFENIFKLYIVDGSEYGDTLAEMFLRAAGGASWLRCANLSLGDAWLEMGINRKPADHVLVHGSLAGDSISDHYPRSGVDLAQKLTEEGYKVNVITAGGSRKLELKGFERESGLYGFTDADIQSMLLLLEIAVK